MAEIVLFPHVLGVTEGVRAFARTLEEAGHTVHVSDAFDGVTFTDLDAGIAYAREIGDELIGRRADETVAGLPAGLVYLGMSLGVVSAQRLAQQRPGARGAVLLYSCLPAVAFGGWPSGLRAQVHGMDDDPYFAHEGDLDAARARSLPPSRRSSSSCTRARGTCSPTRARRTTTPRPRRG